MDQHDRELTVIIADDSELRLDKALLANLPDDVWLSRSRLSKLIREGGVSHAGEVITKASHLASAGQAWTVRAPADPVPGPIPEDIPLNIVHEDEEIIVIDKTSGMVVHPARGNRTGTLLNAILHYCGSSLPDSWSRNWPGLVHRLDKDTSGLMVLARTERAMLDLVRQFSERSAGRIYTAVVRGDPASLAARHVDRMDIRQTGKGAFRLESLIGRNPQNRLRHAVLQRGGRVAITNIRTTGLLADGNCAEVECRLETGRTHQIRVHMAHAGHPLVGDQTYGTGSVTLPSGVDGKYQETVRNFSRQALHAGILSLDHPATGKRCEFRSALPEDMKTLLNDLA